MTFFGKQPPHVQLHVAVLIILQSNAHVFGSKSINRYGNGVALHFCFWNDYAKETGIVRKACLVVIKFETNDTFVISNVFYGDGD